MANEKKLTKREKFEMIAKIEAVASNPILAEFVEHELELLAKKNASSSGTLNANQKENEKIKELIEGKEIVKIICVPKKLVNIVVK